MDLKTLPEIGLSPEDRRTRLEAEVLGALHACSESIVDVAGDVAKIAADLDKTREQMAVVASRVITVQREFEGLTLAVNALRGLVQTDAQRIEILEDHARRARNSRPSESR